MRPLHPAAILLTALDVARLLRVGERTVWRHARAGVLPAPVRFGRAVRWVKADVLSYVAGLKAARQGR